MPRKKVEEIANDFSLREVIDKFGDRDQSSDLSGLGYDLSHYLFDLLKNFDSGGDLTVRELSELSVATANRLGEKYLIIKKEYS